MKLIILDRDGVINHDSDEFIKHPDEWRPIPGSLEAIARLTQSGWRAVVATNQSGVGRGLMDMASLNAITGMFFAIAERLNVALDQAPCVGDSLRDLQAAAAIGAHPILVLTGKGRKTRTAGKLPEGTAVYPDLAAVAHALCQ